MYFANAPSSPPDHVKKMCPKHCEYTGCNFLLIWWWYGNQLTSLIHCATVCFLLCKSNPSEYSTANGLRHRPYLIKCTCYYSTCSFVRWNYTIIQITKVLYSLYNNSGTTGLQVVLKGEVVVSGNPQSDFVPLRYSNLKYIPMTHALPDGEDNELLTFHFNSFMH